MSGLARLVMGFALASATIAAPVVAAQHRGHSTGHKTGRTSHDSKTARSRTSKSHSGHKTTHGKVTHGKTSHGKHAAKTPAKPASRAPGGAMTVPGGGLKVYCAAGKNPLMVRKMTQGAGTTVTVLCR